MLLAEAFVLLALDPDGSPAKGRGNRPATTVGVTGALVAELILDGDLDLIDRRVRLHDTRPRHWLLARTVEALTPYDGRVLSPLLTALPGTRWADVVDAMVDAGTLRRPSRAFRPTRLPVTDPDAHAALLADVRQAAVSTAPLTDQQAVLLALAGPCQMLRVVAPRRADRWQANRRILEATRQVPVADAVRTATGAVKSEFDWSGLPL